MPSHHQMIVCVDLLSMTRVLFMLLSHRFYFGFTMLKIELIDLSIPGKDSTTEL